MRNKTKCAFPPCDRPAEPYPRGERTFCRGHRAQVARHEELRPLRAWKRRR